MSDVHLRLPDSGCKRRTVCGLWLAGGIVDVWRAAEVTCQACQAEMRKWGEVEVTVHLQRPFIREVLTCCGLQVQGVSMWAQDKVTCPGCRAVAGLGSNTSSVAGASERRTVEVTFQVDVPEAIPDETLLMTVEMALDGWKAGPIQMREIGPGGGAVYAPGFQSEIDRPVSGVGAGGPGFEVLARLIRSAGVPYPGGVWLRTTAGRAWIACRECGNLTPEPGEEGMRGWTSDWSVLAGLARAHAEEAGHEVAVQSWIGAVYGPESPARPTAPPSDPAAGQEERDADDSQ